MTEVFSLGANQEPERQQCALFYPFLGRHFLSSVYSFPTLALREWILFSRLRLVSLFILWLFRICHKWRKLHWSVDTMTAVEDDLQCSVCRLPLKDPMQTKCGHRFCRTCLGEHFKRFAFLINAKWLLFISLRSVYVCEQIHSFSSYVWFWVEYLSCLYCLSIPIHFGWLWYMKGLSPFFKFATESDIVQRFCRITKHL